MQDDPCPYCTPCRIGMQIEGSTFIPHIADPIVIKVKRPAGAGEMPDMTPAKRKKSKKELLNDVWDERQTSVKRTEKERQEEAKLSNLFDDLLSS